MILAEAAQQTSSGAPWWTVGLIGAGGVILGALINILGTRSSDRRKAMAERDLKRSQMAIEYMADFLATAEKVRSVRTASVKESALKHVRLSQIDPTTEDPKLRAEYLRLKSDIADHNAAMESVLKELIPDTQRSFSLLTTVASPATLDYAIVLHGTVRVCAFYPEDEKMRENLDWLMFQTASVARKEMGLSPMAHDRPIPEELLEFAKYSAYGPYDESDEEREADAIAEIIEDLDER